MKMFTRTIKLAFATLLVSGSLVNEGTTMHLAAGSGAEIAKELAQKAAQFALAYKNSKDDLEGRLNSLNMERNEKGFCPLITTSDLADVALCGLHKYGSDYYISNTSLIKNPVPGTNYTAQCSKNPLYNKLKSRKKAQARLAHTGTAIGKVGGFSDDQSSAGSDEDPRIGLSTKLVYAAGNEQVRQGHGGKEKRSGFSANSRAEEYTSTGCVYHYTVGKQTKSFILRKFSPPRPGSHPQAIATGHGRSAGEHLGKAEARNLQKDCNKVIRAELNIPDTGAILDPTKKKKYQVRMKQCCHYNKQGDQRKYTEGNNFCGLKAPQGGAHGSAAAAGAVGGTAAGSSNDKHSRSSKHPKRHSNILGLKKKSSRDKSSKGSHKNDGTSTGKSSKNNLKNKRSHH